MMTVAPTLSPQVLWSQRSDTLTLVINLVDATNEEMDLKENSLNLKRKIDALEYAIRLEEANSNLSKFMNFFSSLKLSMIIQSWEDVIFKFTHCRVIFPYVNIFKCLLSRLTK